MDVRGSNGQQGLWLPRVPDTSVSGIRALNPPDGLVIYHPPSGKMFFRSNNAWKEYLYNGILSVTVGASTMTGPALRHDIGNAGNTFNISSLGNTATWNIRSSSATARGLISTTPQNFAGKKTFNDSIIASNGSRLNGGTLADSVTVSGGILNVSDLTLGINSATAAGTAVTKYLSVDSAGSDATFNVCLFAKEFIRYCQ